ncbi:MAG: AmmeMemoRadiSam system protein B [Candidatus Hydrogenedentes bacterium]|nr:AmmeMemoRadiSam system protein B [Candidatus Hydrogenedentota bacterium]
MARGTIRKPAVAGRFYPSDPVELQEMVDRYIKQAEVTAAPDRAACIVAPHAGYVYSGPTAGFVYARILGKQPGRVILLGCSHRYPIETASVFTRGAFETPVGCFPVDEEFADRIAEETESTTVEPHLLEHALEVQLPFLKAAVGEVPIVPILFGSPPGRWHAEIGQRIASMVGDDDLVIASTDLSHYMTEEQAHRKDKQSIDALLSKDWAVYTSGVATGACSMCGSPAVVAAMAYALARGAEEWTLLDYRTSADASGDHERVVGYAAVTMEHPA